MTAAATLRTQAAAAFHAERPHEALRLLGEAARTALDPELLADLAAVALRTDGPASAAAPLVLAGVAGHGAHDEVQANDVALARHRTRGIVPEVVARVVTAALRPPVLGNVDTFRWPDGMPAMDADASAVALLEVLARTDELEWLADRLDPESREVLAQVLVFRVLGHERAAVGPGLQRQYELLAEARASLLVQADVTDLDYGDGTMSHIVDVRPLGFPVERLEVPMWGLQGTFQLEQYRCPAAPQAHVRPGDVVLDGGGFFGDTSLYFAHLVGERGRVICSEFAPHNLAFLHRNLAACPELAARVTLDGRALWSRSGEVLEMSEGGPSTTVVGGPGYLPVTSVTIDDLVATGVADRIDFIKLDIEGAELAAMAGARDVLARFRPRLALSVYHRPDDLWEIAHLIDGLDLGYRFALGHFTLHTAETILFGWVEDR